MKTLLIQLTCLPNKTCFIAFTLFLIPVLMANAQVEQELLPFGLGNGSQFGFAVDVGDTFFIAGANRSDLGANNAGVCYIYRNNQTQWEVDQIIGSNDLQNSDEFGYAVAIDGSTVAVGAPFEDANGSASGSVYIFQRIDTTWVQTQKLTAPDASGNDRFGNSLDMEDNTLVVGSYLDDDFGSSSGSAYVFNFDGNSWQFQQKLFAIDGLANDQFGFDVSITSSGINPVIAVGAPFHNIVDDEGAVYLYQFDGSFWNAISKVQAFDAGTNDFFGEWLDLSGNILVVGSRLDDDVTTNSGSAYIYQFNGLNWNFAQKITAPNPSETDQFGWSVAVSNQTIVVGARQKDYFSILDAGIAYTFTNNGQSWIFESILTSDNPQGSDNLGYAVSINNGVIAAGAPFNDDVSGNSGKVLIFGDGIFPNASCNNAVPIACDETFVGSYASSDGMPPAQICAPTSSNTRGAWYEFTGTGTITQVTLRSSLNLDFLTVFTGECDTPICVSTVYDSINNQRTAIFNTDLNESYYLFINGIDAAFETFEIRIGCWNPINDVCVNSLNINCGDTILATTNNANAVNPPSCFGSSGQRGLWYSLEGNGEVITLSLCGSFFDTRIDVLEGTCTGFACLKANDDFCGLSSQVTFFAEAAKDYIVYVSGFGNDAGVLQLAMSCDVPNVCEEAISIGCGETIVGSTTPSTTNFVPACDSDLTTAPGVWFEFVGTGDVITASLCGSLYDTQIGIYTGGCNNLACAFENDDTCGLQSEVEFLSEKDEVYYLYVTGFETNSGQYTLSMTCRPSNDDCIDAETIVCGQNITNSTPLATIGNPPPNCNQSYATSPGVWYRYIAQDEVVARISLCGSNFDTQLGVFAGTCQGLTCIAGNDDFCGLGSQIDFFPVAGTQYYIYVAGFGTSTGQYNLNLRCFYNNDLCTTSESISCGETLVGSTATLATSNDAPGNCGVSLSSAPGVWYDFIGNGLNVTASLCNSNFDTKIGIYRGSCSNLICVGGSDDDCGSQSAITFPTLSGQQYYVYVTGFDTGVGDYELSLNCISPASCTNVPPVATTTNIGPTTARLEWNSIPGAMGYEITGGLIGGGTITIDVDQFPTFFDVENLSINTTYVWSVKGKCTMDGSFLTMASNIDTFSTVAPMNCFAPDSIFTDNITATSVRLNWTAVPGANGYQISGSLLGSTAEVTLVINNPTTLFFNAANLSPGASYSWEVRSICDEGLSVPTAQNIFILPTTLKAAPLEVNEVFTMPAVSVFPNPASNFIIVEWNGEASGSWSARIYNAQGRLMTDGTFDQERVQIEIGDQWVNGLYQLVLENQYGSRTEKFIVVK